MNKRNKTDSTDWSLYWRLVKQASLFWPQILAMFLLGLASTPLTLLGPVPLKIAVDCVVGSEPLPGILAAITPAAMTQSDFAILLFAAGLMVAVALLSKFHWIISSALNLYTREKLVLGFQSKLFHHAQRLSLSYHDSRGTMDAIYRIKNDAPSVQYIAIDGIIPFVSAVVTLVAMLYITIRLDWQLTLIGLAVAPVLVVATRAFRGRIRDHSRRAKEIDTSFMAVMQETFSALRVVKAFGQEQREEERLVKAGSKGVRARLRLLIIESGFSIVTGLATTGTRAVVLFVGVLHVMDQTLSLGELLLLMNYLRQLHSPLKTISKKFTSLQSHLASAERAFELIDTGPDVPERPDARSIDRANGSVAFVDVSFAYSEERPVLRNIDFAVEPGTRVGIAGKTGSGKTTLMSLLTRFYDPSNGQILLDGVDLREYNLDDLRAQFAIVLQEPVLFSTTITENIAYARADATIEEIEEAARAANAHDFIAQLPNGYETQVGERGMQLSGGERQRIALARAFLKDAPILILDEPTSSVDMQTEAVIMEAMERLMYDRTVFMIAHRLSTLNECDQLLVVENGRLLSSTKKRAEIIRATSSGKVEVQFASET